MANKRTRYCVKVFSKQWTWYSRFRTEDLEEAKQIAKTQAEKTGREHQIWDRQGNQFVSRHLPQKAVS